MKISPKQLAKIIKNAKSDEELRQCLLHIFSFKENIDVFSLFLFPDTCTNKIPKFHKELFDILFQDGSDAIAAPRGHGKQISDNTPILTVGGWKTHGELNIGDFVFSPSGKPIRIIAKTNKSPSNYVVTFRNKEQIRCHVLHEWVVFDRNKKDYVLIETKDMIGDWSNKGQRSRFQLPFRNPLINQKIKLKVDPYFLGLWLGDGSECKPCITHSKDDIKTVLSVPYKISTICTHNITKVLTTYFSYNGLINDFKKMNIYGNKHIPELYFKSSIEQRLELLAGLIDSDGHVDKVRGRVRFVNINYKLIKDVERLVLSLGSNPYITSQEGINKIFPNGKYYNTKKVYTLNFDPVIDIPTRLLRNKIRRFPERKKIGITKVSYEPNGEIGNCIEVDSPDGLYLVGNKLIPTHNSSATGLIFLIFCIVNKLEKYIVYISQNHAKTVQFLDPIRNEFKNNDNLKFVYGDFKLMNSRGEDGRDREDCFDVGDARVEAVSFEKNLRGFKFGNIRPTLIICDDIEEDMRTLNPDLRVKDEHKLNKIIIPSLDIDGRIKIIGTLLHIDSLLHKKIKQYGGKIYRACDENYENLLWGDRFTKAKLLGIKKSIGSIAFAQEYMNNPVDVENNLIKREWIEACYDKTISFEEASKLPFTYKNVGVDFAFSDRISADQSAFVSLGIYKDKKYIFDCETRKGMSLTEQMDYIRYELHKKHKYNQIGLEENSIRSISKDLLTDRMPLTLFWTGANDPAKKQREFKDKEFKGKRHTVGKTNLIMRLATAFENKEFVIPYKTDRDKVKAHAIMNECISFALASGKLVEAGVHPDIPIGLGYALELITMKRGHSFFFG